MKERQQRAASAFRPLAQVLLAAAALGGALVVARRGSDGTDRTVERAEARRKPKDSPRVS